MISLVILLPVSESFEQSDINPSILVPTNLTVDAKDKIGAKVSFEVRAVDESGEEVNVSCFPESGSYFLIGENEVKCIAMDLEGNKSEKSFIITVNSGQIEIPDRIRVLAGAWCNNETDDSSFADGIQYLLDSNIIITTLPLSDSNSEIPNWLRNNACWWSAGVISDADFTSGLEYLLKHNIIRI